MENTKLIASSRVRAIQYDHDHMQGTAETINQLCDALEAAEAELTRRATVIAEVRSWFEEHDIDIEDRGARFELQTILVTAPVSLEAVKAETTTEERWIPIHVSGAEWGPRSRQRAEECLAHYPRDWTFAGEEDGGPNGLVGIRQEVREVTEWRPVKPEEADRV